MMPSRRFPVQVRGFTLVELMVALTLGLLIMAGIIAVMLSSKATYTHTGGLSKAQENARFTMNFLANELRRSGFYGCVYSNVAVENQLNAVAGSGLNPAALAITIEGEAPLQVEAFEADGTGWFPTGGSLPSTVLAGTDAIRIRYLDMDTQMEVLNYPESGTVSATVADPIYVDPSHKFSPGDIVVVADCDSADVIQITTIGDATITTTDSSGAPVIVSAKSLTHTTTGGFTPGNSSADLSKTYGRNARVMVLKTVTYTMQTGAGGKPALFRDNTEMVEGVDNMQIQYGSVDMSTGARNVAYLKADELAASDWRNIISMRIGILTSGESTDTDDQPLDLLGYTVAASNEKRQRRTFVSTINLRNIRK